MLFRKQNLVLLRLSPSCSPWWWWWGGGGRANVLRLWTRRLEEQNPVSRNPYVPQEEQSAVKQA